MGIYARCSCRAEINRSFLLHNLIKNYSQYLIYICFHNIPLHTGSDIFRKLHLWSFVDKAFLMRVSHTQPLSYVSQTFCTTDKISACRVYSKKYFCLCPSICFAIDICDMPASSSSQSILKLFSSTYVTRNLLPAGIFSQVLHCSSLARIVLYTGQTCGVRL